MSGGIGLAILPALLIAAAGPLHRQGVDFYKNHKYNEAIAALEKSAAAETPGSPEYNESVLLIGQSYFMLSNAPKAIPWLEKAPGLNEANYMLGYAYIQASQPEKSEAAFARLFDVPANSPRGHLVAAQMLLKKEYRDEARREARKALALDPKLAEAHFLLGEMDLGGGMVDAAIADFQAELALNPASSSAWYRLGDAYTRQGKWASAVPVLQRAIWLNPDFSGPFILLGKCYLKQNNLDNAEGILRGALTLDPKNREANYLLGQTLSAEGRKNEAEQILEKLK